MSFANIKAFKAVLYNQERIKNLSDVVCPPYDVISPAEQDSYHKQDPFNFIRILLGKDVSAEDKYKRAGFLFREWQREGIFVQDKKEAIYFYSQQYNIRGEKRTRLGFIALLRLADNSSSVFGHENTRKLAKEDRAKLLREVKANLSPIFSIFLDNKRIISRLFQKNIQASSPFIQVTDKEKTVHKLWKIDDPKMIDSVVDSLSGENVFIADGHHRYEVASNYRDEMKEKLGSSFTGEENFNYVLSYFTNTDPRGLSILPIHRLVRLGNVFDQDAFRGQLKNYFDIDEIKDRTKFFFLMEKGAQSGHIIGMYKDKKFYLLRLKNITILDKEITNKPKEYKTLDVCILNTLVLKNILGIDSENKECIVFNPDHELFVKEVDKDPALIAFFLNPVKFEQIASLALKGERMPSKSTYFYPKVLSGLVINKLE